MNNNPSKVIFNKHDFKHVMLDTGIQTSIQIYHQHFGGMAPNEK